MGRKRQRAMMFRLACISLLTVMTGYVIKGNHYLVAAKPSLAQAPATDGSVVFQDITLLHRTHAEASPTDRVPPQKLGRYTNVRQKHHDLQLIHRLPGSNYDSLYGGVE